ncbi:unnamed protein product [Arabis nemorensis]|uniref:Uncharacterized protein n=1 Tax=Arabis nemorensis TaxID=586526 RepID=A0A565AT83_9BRAS|nr:unnamed protein product [Arabis nemorensis]
MGSQENVKHLEVHRFQCIKDMGILSPRRVGCNPSGHQTKISRSTGVLRHNGNNARHHHRCEPVRKRTRRTPNEVTPRLSKRHNNNHHHRDSS